MKKSLSIKILFLVITASVVLGLGIISTSAAPKESSLKIKSFKASKNDIKSGQSVKLKWFVYNAVDIEIIGLEKTPEENFKMADSIEVWPLITTTYVLNATGKNGDTISTSLTVNVSEKSKSKAKIHTFKASKTNIKNGESVKLSWKVSKASKIEIIGLEKTPEDKLPLKGSLEFWPMKTTTYVLNAYGKDGAITSKTVTVNVKNDSKLPAPTIVRFVALSTKMSSGNTIILSWEVKDAEKVELKGIEKEPEGELKLTDRIEVWPMATTEYTLTAYNKDGVSVSKSLTVKPD